MGYAILIHQLSLQFSFKTLREVTLVMTLLSDAWDMSLRKYSLLPRIRGVGEAMFKRLQANNIFTISQLLEKSPGRLAQIPHITMKDAENLRNVGTMYIKEDDYLEGLKRLHELAHAKGFFPLKRNFKLRSGHIDAILAKTIDINERKSVVLVIPVSLFELQAPLRLRPHRLEPRNYTPMSKYAVSVIRSAYKALNQAARVLESDFYGANRFYSEFVYRSQSKLTVKKEFFVHGQGKEHLVKVEPLLVTNTPVEISTDLVLGYLKVEHISVTSFVEISSFLRGIAEEIVFSEQVSGKATNFELYYKLRRRFRYLLLFASAIWASIGTLFGILTLSDVSQFLPSMVVAPIG